MPIAIPSAPTPVNQVLTTPPLKISAADVATDLTALSAIFTLPTGVTVAQLKAINVTFSPDGSANLRVSYVRAS